MRKICFVVASRANYGRVRSVILECKKRSDLDVQVIATASALISRYGDGRGYLAEDGIDCVEVPCLVEGGTHLTMALTTGLALTAIAPVLATLAPDVVVTVADRHETLATAIAARYQNIALAHIQGGEVSGSIDDRVRDAVTMLADLHFTATLSATERVEQMRGGAGVYHVGCPGIDGVDRAKPRPRKLAERISGGRYALVVYHPDTDLNSSTALAEVSAIHEAVAYGPRHVVWLWPNCDAGTDAVSTFLRREADRSIHLFRGFSPEEYASVLLHATFAIGNSSSFVREGAYLGVPAVIVGTRQSGREKGPNALSCDYYEAKDAVAAVCARPRMPSDLYGQPGAGEAIAAALATCELPQRARS